MFYGPQLFGPQIRDNNAKPQMTCVTFITPKGFPLSRWVSSQLVKDYSTQVEHDYTILLS